MSFLTRIRSWLKPTKRQALPTPPASPKPARSSTRSLPVASQHDPIPAPVDTRVRLTVFFRVHHTQQQLRDPIVLRGAVGEPVTIPWITLPGYVLAEITGFTAFFPAVSGPIYCDYTPQVAGPVIIYHRDTHGQLLVPPEILTGEINAPFEAYALTASVDEVVGEPVQQGHFKNTSQTLHFTYQLDLLEPGQAPTSTYVMLDAPKKAFASPTADQPLATVLPARTIWRVYSLMREQHNQQIWLALGGSQWITATDTHALDNVPFLGAPVKAALAKPHLQALRHDLHTTAVVAGGTTDVTVWSAPYGDMLPDRLASGTEVKVVAHLTLPDHTTWFELNGGAFVLGPYLTLSANQKEANG